jgi:RNA polymerase sigma-70 factor (ECF subfamily)
MQPTDLDGLRPGDQIPGRTPSPVDVLQTRDQNQAIRDLVKTLPDFLRQVVILAFFQNMKYADIAEVLGIPLGTVKSRMSAALALLRNAWPDAER